jgi:ATP-dependent Clp protease protease subunit
LVVPTSLGVATSTPSARANGNDMGLDAQVFNRLLKERIIFLGSPVMDEIANAICAQLLLLAAEDPDRDIFLYINSPGGSISAGMAIYDTPHARIMMHQPSGGIGGTAADIAIQAEQMLYVKKQMAERISFHTGQSPEQIERDSDRDRWFSADEAKDYGFIDHVVAGAAQVPSGAGTRS